MIKWRKITINWREYRLYRWLRGGLWIKHDDRGWVRGTWMRNFFADGLIYDENHCGYHRTLNGILKIEDYTE